MEQFKVKFYIKGRIRPLITVVFTSKTDIDDIINQIYESYAIVNNVVITKTMFSYAKIKTM